MTAKNGQATERGPSALVWTLCVASGVYARSSIQRLAGGDSGELLAEACVGGVAHPPGYPLLLLALRATRWIGGNLLPDVPFVVLANCVNALFAAGATACVTHVVTLLRGSDAPVEAVVAGLLFAFSALTWEYALGLEVFALNNLLVGLLLVGFVRHFVRPQSIKNVCAGALLCGLGLSNQHTSVLFEIPLILWILASSSLSVVNWICLTASFIVGLSPYIYTFVAAQTPTAGSWGDTSSLHGLWTHIFRREYGTFQLSPLQSPSNNLASRLSVYFEGLISEFTVVGFILALVGIFCGPLLAFFKSNRGAVAVKAKIKSPKPTPTTSFPSHPPPTVACALLVAFTFYIMVFNALANLPLGDPLTREITRRFFMQPNMIVAVWIGLGLSFLHNHIHIPGAARLVAIGSLALVAHQYHRNHHAFTKSSIAEHDLVRGFGSSILESLPKNAILLSYTDIQWNSVRYLQQCEHKRTDVVHLNLQIMAFPWFQRQQKLYPTVKFPANLPDISTNRSSQGYASYLSRFVLANLQPHDKKHKRPIFLDLHGVDEATIAGEQLFFGHLQVLPHGLVWQIIQSTTANQDNAERLRRSWQQYAEHRPEERPEDADLLMRCCGLSTSGAAPPVDIQRGSWEFVVVSIAHDAMYQQGLTRLGYWLTHGSQIKSVVQLEEAVLAYGDIHHELNELVLAGVKTIGGAISYDLYAVEKNAVVSRQRFQLYLEALADLLERTAANAVELSPRAKRYVENRGVSRRETISQVSRFLEVMEAQHDDDSQTLRKALETLQQKEQVDEAPPWVKPGKKKTRKKAKKNRP